MSRRTHSTNNAEQAAEVNGIVLTSRRDEAAAQPEAARAESQRPLIRKADIPIGASNLDREIKEKFNTGQRLLTGTPAMVKGYYRVEKNNCRLVVTNNEASIATNDDGFMRRIIHRGEQMRGTWSSDTRGVFTANSPLFGSHEAQKYIVNVPPQKYLKVFIAGEPVILDSGTHVIVGEGKLTLPDNDLRSLSEKNHRIDTHSNQVNKSTEMIHHNSASLLTIPQGKLAMCLIDNQVRLYNGQVEPYDIRYQREFKIIGNQFYSANHPAISCQNIMRLFIPKDQVAAIVVDGVPQFIEGESREILVEGKMKVELTPNGSQSFFPKVTPVIQNQSWIRLFVQPGQIAAAKIDGIPTLFDSKEGPVVLGNKHGQVEIIRKDQSTVFFSETDPVIRCGNGLRLFIAQNEIATVLINGKPTLLEGRSEAVNMLDPSKPAMLLTKSQQQPFYDKSDALIQCGNMLRLRVPIGKQATLKINGEPTIIQGDGRAKIYGGDGEIVEFMRKSRTELFYTQQDPLIQAGPLVSLMIPKGNIATLLIDGVGQIIEGNGEVKEYGKDGERIQVIRKSDSELFHKITDPIIQVGQKVRLTLPPGRILPAIVDGKESFLTAANNEHFTGDRDITFQISKQGGKSETLLPLDTSLIECGSLKRVFLQPGFVGVTKSSEGTAVLSPKSGDIQGVHIIDPREKTWIGQVSILETTLTMPSSRIKDEHTARGGMHAENAQYDIYRCQGGVPVGVRFNIVYKVEDPVKLAMGVDIQSIEERIENIIQADMGSVIGQLHFSKIRGSSTTTEEQNDGSATWHAAVQDKLGTHFDDLGVRLVSIQISDCEILDKKILEDQAENADKALQQKLELDQMGVASQLAQARAQQEQSVLTIKQQAQLQRDLEKQDNEQKLASSAQQATQVRETKLLEGEQQRQNLVVDNELIRAEKRVEIAAALAKAAALEAEAKLAPDFAMARLLNDNPKYAEYLLKQQQIAATIKICAGATFQRNSLSPEEMLRWSMQAVNSGQPGLFAQAMYPRNIPSQHGLFARPEEQHPADAAARVSAMHSDASQ